MIKFDKLSFTYNGMSQPALQDINLSIEDGEFILITGPSGSGKSTLARCFNGLVPHFHGGIISGKAEVQGMNILRCPPKQMADRVGMVFQDPENQLVTSDVEREIAFGLENLSFPVNLIVRRIEESLDTIGIANLRSRNLHDLSGGEKQKVAIASVLALHPEVLVLDEPTSELDPQSAEEVLKILERLNDELGITIILIEHRLDRVIHLVDRMLNLNGGKITADGQPRNVIDGITMDEVSMGIPPVIRLMKSLRSAGLVSGDLPLTVKDARLSLQKTLQTTKTVTFQNSVSQTRPVLTVDKLWFSYGQRNVLKNIGLTLNEGEFVAVMGRNGSGKTTLVKHLNGLLKPIRGKVTVYGMDTRQKSVSELSRQVGYVFQNPDDHLFADTVEEEIAFSLKNRGIEHNKIMQMVDSNLNRFRLEKYRQAYPRDLSGGEKQRLALASVMANEPKIVILDEPTRGMDYILKKELIWFLEEYRQRGNTIIIVTHDVEMIAECASRVILISEGRIVGDGDKRKVLSKALLFSPQINRLAQALSKYGIDDTTLTVDEMIRQTV